MYVHVQNTSGWVCMKRQYGMAIQRWPERPQSNDQITVKGVNAASAETQSERDGQCG